MEQPESSAERQPNYFDADSPLQSNPGSEFVQRQAHHQAPLGKVDE